jgi:AhpD family alkylhydroperoxidase
MWPHNYLSEQVAIPEDSVAIANRARAARSRAIGTAAGGGAKSLQVFMSPLIRRLTGFSASKPTVSGLNGSKQNSARWIWPKKPLVLGDLQQQTVYCDVGTIWITQGDSNDYVLKAGEKLILHPRDEVIINAMAGPALIRLTLQPHPQPLLPEKEHVMNELTLRERELVALGAAMGSNCQPCIEFHIPAARNAGLSDIQISQAIRIADTVRKVPALKVLNAALGMLPHEAAALPANDGADQCTGAATVGCCA